MLCESAISHSILPQQSPTAISHSNLLGLIPPWVFPRRLSTLRTNFRQCHILVRSSLTAAVARRSLADDVGDADVGDDDKGSRMNFDVVVIGDAVLK